MVVPEAAAVTSDVITALTHFVTALVAPIASAPIAVLVVVIIDVVCDKESTVSKRSSLFSTALNVCKTDGRSTTSSASSRSTTTGSW